MKVRAIIECALAYFYDIRRQRHRGKVLALVEGIFSNGGDSNRPFHLREFLVFGEQRTQVIAKALAAYYRGRVLPALVARIV